MNKTLLTDWYDIDIGKYDTLFLDRDGTINVHLPGTYVKSWSEFEFLPNFLEVVPYLSSHFKYILVVTNQRGVSKKILTEDVLDDIHMRMCDEIARLGGRIDKVYYCTALLDSDLNRKPNIGMALQAKEDFPDILFSKSLMIGDSKCDELFAKACNMDFVYVNPNGVAQRIYNSF